mgnify:CR=1 FL=1
MGASIIGLKLFAGNKNGVTPTRREYVNTFSVSQPRHIWWELELSHPESTNARNPLIEAILFNPMGEAIFRTGVNLEIAGGTEISKHVYQLSKNGSGPWEPGRYILDLYVSGERVAGTSFNMKQ